MAFSFKRETMRQLFQRLVFLLFIVAVASVLPPSALAAQQKVVLLTSVNTKGCSSCFGSSYYRTYVPKLEEQFRKQFEKTSYIIEILHDADQFQLWSVLHDPQNVAVFWLSHASWAGASGDNFGLLSTHRIIDAKGFDVTPVFEKIHPNLRFLAVIGCFSAEIMNQVGRVGIDPQHPAHSDHPLLRLFTFHDRVDAKKGLAQAIAASKKVLEIPEIRLGYTSQCPVTLGYRVRATRRFSVSGDPGKTPISLLPERPAARIMMDGQVVNAFPQASWTADTAYPVQVHEFILPKTEELLSDLRMDVGDNAEIQVDKARVSRLDVGQLELSLVASGEPEFKPWDLWRMTNGRPLGIFTHGFKPKGELLKTVDLSKYLVRGSEFRCDPMPSYE
jgi:hypothetical protein